MDSTYEKILYKVGISLAAAARSLGEQQLCGIYSTALARKDQNLAFAGLSRLGEYAMASAQMQPRLPALKNEMFRIACRQYHGKATVSGKQAHDGGDETRMRQAVAAARRISSNTRSIGRVLVIGRIAHYKVIVFLGGKVTCISPDRLQTRGPRRCIEVVGSLTDSISVNIDAGNLSLGRPLCQQQGNKTTARAYIKKPSARYRRQQPQKNSVGAHLHGTPGVAHTETAELKHL